MGPIFRDDGCVSHRDLSATTASQVRDCAAWKETRLGQEREGGRRREAIGLVVALAVPSREHIAGRLQFERDAGVRAKAMYVAGFCKCIYKYV